MATPTDQQQIRATLRRHARTYGDDMAAGLALGALRDLFGADVVAQMLPITFPDMAPAVPDDVPVPPLMGAAEAADVLGMKATNLKRLSPPLVPVQVVSGRIPVYRESDVMAAKRRRDERRRAA